jgi:hypothetical protein
MSAAPVRAFLVRRKDCEVAQHLRIDAFVVLAIRRRITSIDVVKERSGAKE